MRHLRLVERRLGIEINNRGSSFRLLGEPAAVAAGREVLQDLYAATEGEGGVVALGDTVGVEGALALAVGPGIDEDVVAVEGFEGNPPREGLGAGAAATVEEQEPAVVAALHVPAPDLESVRHERQGSGIEVGGRRRHGGARCGRT